MTTNHVKLISLDNPHDHYINNEPVVPSNIIIMYNLYYNLQTAGGKSCSIVSGDVSN